MIRSASRMAALAAAMFAGVALAQTPAPAPAPAKCTDCGVVETVRFVEVKGSSSGVGMVAGGVLGGVLGHQIGSGRGNTVATIAGAAGGAYVGNEIEKKKNTKGQWNVVIRMDSGQQRTFVYTNQPTVHDGDRVKLIDGGRRLALVAS
jgi:outer membrane lipoprotein SlyB